MRWPFFIAFFYGLPIDFKHPLFRCIGVDNRQNGGWVFLLRGLCSRERSFSTEMNQALCKAIAPLLVNLLTFNAHY